MRRLTLFLTALIMSAAVCAQEPLLDSDIIEEAEPELRRYTVEVIVFAYAEDVSAGSELFLPEIIEVVEPDPLALAEPGEEGAIADDSVPNRDAMQYRGAPHA